MEWILGENTGRCWGRRWVWPGFGGWRLCAVMTVALGVVGTLPGGCMPDSILITPVSSSRQMREREVMRESLFAWDTIAIIDVEGVILDSHTPKLIGRGEHPVSRLLEQLDKARRDPRVKAVILRINSPGGGVTASDMMYEEIRHFRECGKPVVAVMMDVAASGGYYIACACDEIIAQRTTVTGSIGVIMQLFDASGTLKMVGLRSNAITSGPRKGGGSPFKELSDEDRALFQAMVDDMYARFVEVVAQGRPKLDEAAVRRLADGRVFTARQALDAGLIDRIATMREAIDAVKARIGARKVRVVAYHRPVDYVANYYGRLPGGAPEASSSALDIQIRAGQFDMTPRFLYLWAPGL